MDIYELGEQLRRRLDDEKLNFESLSEAERVFLAILELDGEVCNGGFEQYFFNPAGEHAFFAPIALQLLGAHQMADVVLRAVQVFRPEGSPRDWNARREALGKLDINAKTKLDLLTDEFYKYSDEVRTSLMSYARKHFGESFCANDG